MGRRGKKPPIFWLQMRPCTAISLFSLGFSPAHVFHKGSRPIPGVRTVGWDGMGRIALCTLQSATNQYDPNMRILSKKEGCFLYVKINKKNFFEKKGVFPHQSPHFL